MTKHKNNSFMTICRCLLVLIVISFFFGGFSGALVIFIVMISIFAILSIARSANSNKDFNPNPAPIAPAQTTLAQTPQPVIQQALPAQVAPQLNVSDMEVQFCPLCGERVSKNAKFCNVCGGKID